VASAGIGSNGPEAAGEFIVSPERLSELLRSAPPGWKNGNFEAVLKVEVVDGSTGASSIVASEFLVDRLFNLWALLDSQPQNRTYRDSA